MQTNTLEVFKGLQAGWTFNSCGTRYLSNRCHRTEAIPFTHAVVCTEGLYNTQSLPYQRKRTNFNKYFYVSFLETLFTDPTIFFFDH